MSTDEKFRPSDESKPLTDRDLVRWVSILRAQRRLPPIVKVVNAQHAGHRLTAARRERIRTEIERRLDEGRVPELGELVKIKVRLDWDPATRRMGIELYAADETLP